MAKIFYFVLFLLQLTLPSCGGDSPQQTFETAELEMLQNNYPHARQLYQEIIAKYPDSDLAAKSGKRLEEIKAIER
jgi:TolA-binding protein